MKSINRILTKPVTRFFLKTPLHPNHITLLSAAAGILAFICFSYGAKISYILGAILFEAFYILDNSDGEVARARGLSSKFGSWLDTSVDYFVHVLAFAGITIGAYRANLHEAGLSFIILIAGIAATLGVFLSFLVVMLQKRKNYGLAVYGMPKAPKGAIKKISFLDRLVDVLSVGDFSIVLLLFALFGKMELLLWLAAFGANIFCIILLILNFKYLTA